MRRGCCLTWGEAPSVGTYDSPRQELVPEGGTFLQAEEDPAWNAVAQPEVSTQALGAPHPEPPHPDPRHQAHMRGSHGAFWEAPHILTTTQHRSLQTPKLFLLKARTAWLAQHRPSLVNQAGPLLTHRGPKRSRHSRRGSCRDKVPLLRVSAEVLKDLQWDRTDRSRALASFPKGTSQKGTGREAGRERKSLDSQLINSWVHKDCRTEEATRESFLAHQQP